MATVNAQVPVLSIDEKEASAGEVMVLRPVVRCAQDPLCPFFPATEIDIGGHCYRVSTRWLKRAVEFADDHGA